MKLESESKIHFSTFAWALVPDFNLNNFTLESDLWSFSDLDSTAPGEKPEFCGVAEQRITGVLIFLMIGLSVFFTPLLRLIPMPVLYGVFLYMGFSSLKGNQLVDRMLLFFMPQKHQPSELYLGCKTAPPCVQNRESFFSVEARGPFNNLLTEILNFH